MDYDEAIGDLEVVCDALAAACSRIGVDVYFRGLTPWIIESLELAGA